MKGLAHLSMDNLEILAGTRNEHGNDYAALEHQQIARVLFSFDSELSGAGKQISTVIWKLRNSRNNDGWIYSVFAGTDVGLTRILDQMRIVLGLF